MNLKSVFTAAQDAIPGREAMGNQTNSWRNWTGRGIDQMRRYIQKSWQLGHWYADGPMDPAFEDALIKEDFYKKVRPARTFYHANGGYDVHRRPYDLAQEDVLLGPLDENIARRMASAQYLRLWDTGHAESGIGKWLSDADTIAMFANMGITHIFPEIPDCLDAHYKSYLAGELTRKTFINDGLHVLMAYLAEHDLGAPGQKLKKHFAAQLREDSQMLDHARHFGMQVHCLDSYVDQGTRIKGDKLTFDFLQRLGRDRALADKIRVLTGDGKALIPWGAGHGAYHGTLDEYLGPREEDLGRVSMTGMCRIAVHANLRQYHYASFNNRYHIDNQPDRIFLVQEGALLMPPPNYAKRADIDKDPAQRLINPEVANLADQRELFRQYFKRTMNLKSSQFQGYF